MAVKLTGLGLKELKALQKKVDSAIQKLESNNLSKARAEAKKLAKEYGVPIESLISSRAPKQPVRKKPTKTENKIPPKYRHPEDGSLTWTGRGVRPKWVNNLLENGGKLEDLQIR